jgi:hippurate hydrolase
MNYDKVPIVDQELLEWIRSIRRTLHQYPELSFQEHRTSAFIQEKLTELGIGYRNGWGGTGVIATIGSNSAHAGHVGLRADMDALPIQDKKTVAYASKIPGVMHACGHDGHVAMLLGAAAILGKRQLAGRVSLIFQPAEEHGNGAAKIIKEGALSNGIAAVFAGHIDTHYPTGTITVDDGVICSSADSFCLRVTGRGGHAARPHEARDAIVAGAYLVTALQTLISRETDPNKSAVVTVGRFQAGEANNVIAEEACIEGTIRSNDQEVRSRILGGLQRICDGVALQYEVEITIEFRDCLPVVLNSPTATKVARYAAQRVIGKKRVISQGRPSLGGEDFAFYQQVVEGCLVRFGASSLSGNGPSHSGSFDFDENVLAVGTAWLACVALQWLKEDREYNRNGRGIKSRCGTGGAVRN